MVAEHWAMILPLGTAITVAIPLSGSGQNSLVTAGIVLAVASASAFLGWLIRTDR